MLLIKNPIKKHTASDNILIFDVTNIKSAKIKHIAITKQYLALLFGKTAQKAPTPAKALDKPKSWAVHCLTS